MKVAVIGSRGLAAANLEKYLPPGTTEIVSGGAKGVSLPVSCFYVSLICVRHITSCTSQSKKSHNIPIVFVETDKPSFSLLYVPPPIFNLCFKAYVVTPFALIVSHKGAYEIGKEKHHPIAFLLVCTYNGH